MLRVDLMADAQFREDALSCIRSIIKREVAPEVVRNLLEEDGFLSKKVEQMFSGPIISGAISTYLERARYWETTSIGKFITRLIEAEVNKRIEKAINVWIESSKQKIAAMIMDLQKDAIKKIVAEELRIRLADSLK